MSTALISTSAVILYLAGTALLAYRLASGRGGHEPPAALGKPAMLVLAVAALVLHATVLSQDMFLPPGLNLGVTNAASLITWMIVIMMVLASVTLPIENMGIFVLPTAALTLIIEQVFPSSRVITAEVTNELKFHILVSILAYSLLTVAALQAILVAIQNRRLRNKHPRHFLLRALPPLQTMEALLFQMIGIGFVLHTIALVTGALYIQDMFAKHLAHKTVLSIIAWGVFGILLWGRHYHGWRGRTAIRWTMTGFVVLFLAYFGSKIVLELILGR